MNPNESTGQQQPEDGAIEFLRSKGILGEDKTQWILNFSDGRTFDLVQLMSEFRSLSRWRSISVDGLPGVQYDNKHLLFANIDGRTEASMWIHHESYFAFYTRVYTHWRPIDLPTP